MSPFPGYTNEHEQPVFPSGPPPPGPLRTSGLAIAAVACGAVGVATCCFLIPSVLAVVFGGLARPEIKRGEKTGGGMAVAGIVLGMIGLVLGTAIWIVALLGPAAAPVVGADVSQRQREALRTIGVLQADEEIVLFYATGMFSVKQGGVLMTDNRLVVYREGAQIQECQFADIASIDYAAAGGWWDEGEFILELEDDEVMTFTIAGLQDGDTLFHRILTRRVTEAREDAGRPEPRSDFSPVNE